MSSRFLFFLAAPLFFPLFAFAEGESRTRAQVNQEVVQTYAAIYEEQKDDIRAEEVIAQYLYLSNESDEGDLWHHLGEIQMRLGKYPDACHAFQKSLDSITVKKDRILGLYQYASCLNRVGRMDDSRKVLVVMAKEEAPLTNAGTQTLSLMKQGLIRPREEFPPFSNRVQGSWRITGGIGIGFDSNVLLLADAIASGTSTSGKGSYFISPAVQAGHYGRIFNDNYETRFLALFTDYLNAEVSSFNSAYSRADFQVGSGPVRWTAFGEAFFLNRSPFQLYSYTGGLSWALKKSSTPTHTTTLEVPVQFQKFLLDSGDNDRSGGDLKVKLTKRWAPDASQLLSLQMNWDGQISTGKNYRLIGLGLPAFFMTELPLIRRLGLLNTFTAEMWGQYYLQSSDHRKDLLLKAGLGIARAIGTAWNLSLDYSAQKNLSSFDSARYSKEVLTLQVSRSFL